MLPFPEIDPVAVQIGPLAIRWYGLSYVAGILIGWWLLVRRARRPDAPFTPDDVGDIVFFAALGGVLGGRLGYIVFYKFDSYVSDPLSIFAVWQGGMAFHGGVIGFVIATAWYARRRGVPFLAVTDFVVPAVPVGLFFGRIANFVNGELWGRVTDVPWAMVFPGAGSAPRHPSQLYEAVLEGLVLFVLLWRYSSRPRPLGRVSGSFLIGYGTFRFLVEFVREPDRHLGFIALDFLTMGQLLSLPMIAVGAVLFASARRGSAPAPART